MNVTKEVELYVTEMPNIKLCLKGGLINYSALTRQILKETKIPEKQFDAVLIAARRYADKLRKQQIEKSKIMDILKKAKIELKNKIMVTTLEKGLYFDSIIDLQKRIQKQGEEINIIQGANATTIVTSQEFNKEIESLFRYKILRSTDNLVKIAIKTSRDIESTPGVIAYLYSLLGEHGINIVETMSCWTDTIVIVEEKDVGKAMSLLKF